jgi:hypothetical protein
MIIIKCFFTIKIFKFFFGTSIFVTNSHTVYLVQTKLVIYIFEKWINNFDKAWEAFSFLCLINLYLNYYIQGVSKFHRQTFRADSMIKNKHKTLNTYGVKNA